MLRTLEIRDILIIDHLDLSFRPGLNVLTGETGAGKSILLDSLGFVLGWRGRADLVRQGAVQGEVTAVFDLPPDHPAQAVLEEAGLPGGEDLILRRVNTVEGRKSAWVNDRRASGEVLRILSRTLVELHGQHDDRGLLDARGHRGLLDNFGRLDAQVAAARGAWSTLRDARAAHEALARRLAAAQAEEQRLRHEAEELSALDPQPGEEAELDARRRRMKAGEKVLGDLAAAMALLDGEDGAEGRLAQAVRWLDGTAGDLDGMADPPMAALDRALSEIGEARDGLEAAMAAFRFDEVELERTEERLFAIRALARKHGVIPEDLPGLASDLLASLEALDRGAGDLKALAKAVTDAEAGYDRAASALSAARADAAEALDDAVMAELAPLKMERAEFRTTVSPAPEGPDGRDAVEFRVATNPGAPSGALQKIASGGELSRFLLALKVCLTTGNAGLTMIFDEIDRGVGGATADAVGRRLAQLAGTDAAQVLVVTHSPQVAARGAHHWQVAKRVEDGLTLSTVTPLEPEERVDEIARMLAGDRITEEARQAARVLLAG